MQIGGTTSTPGSGINLNGAESRRSTSRDRHVHHRRQPADRQHHLLHRYPASTAGVAVNVVSRRRQWGHILDDASRSRHGAQRQRRHGHVHAWHRRRPGDALCHRHATGVQWVHGQRKDAQPVAWLRTTVGTQLTLCQQYSQPAASDLISGAFRTCAGRNHDSQLSRHALLFPSNYQGGDGNDLVLTEVGGPATQFIVTSQPQQKLGRGQRVCLDDPG